MSRVNERELYTDIYNEDDKMRHVEKSKDNAHTHTHWIQIYALNSTAAMGWVAIGRIQRHWLWLQLLAAVLDGLIL